MLKTLETRDYDELTAAQEDWDVRHRPLRPARFEGRLVLGRVGDVRVDLERWSTELELTGSAPLQHLSFVLPLDDDSVYSSGGQEIAPQQLDVFGPGSEVYALMTARTSLISCSIPISVIAERLDSVSTALLTEQAQGHRVLLSDRSATNELRHWWLKLLDIAAGEPTSADALSGLLDETLLRLVRALRVGQTHCDRRLPRRYRLARRARDFMLARQSSPPSIAQVCAFLNVSERTLHYAFSGTYGVSPKQFLKARRLFSARNCLKFAAPDELVSDIAVRLGFWDLSYFSRDYRVMFGELPSATLHRQFG